MYLNDSRTTYRQTRTHKQHAKLTHKLVSGKKSTDLKNIII